MSLLHRVGAGVGCLLIFAAIGCHKNEAADERLAIYKSGIDFVNRGEYQQAVEKFSQLVTQDPRARVLDDSQSLFVSALYWRGVAYLESGSTEQAIDDLSHVIYWQSTNSDAYYKRGLAYRKLKMLDIAKQDFSDAIRARRDDAGAYLQRAMVQFELNDYAAAISDSLESIRLQPINAAAYRVRGEAFLAREEFQLAIDNLEQCLAQDGEQLGDVAPLLSKAYGHRSRELAAAGATADAEKMIQQAQKFDPNFVPFPGPATPREVRAKPPIPDEPAIDKEVEALVATGDECANKKDYKGAHQAYSDAIRKAPQRAELYEKRAANLLAQGFADSAQDDIRDAIQVGGATPERNHLRAWILLGVHDSYTSVEIANYLIRQNADDAEAYAIRGTAYLNRDLLDETIRDLNYAIELSPSLQDRVKSTLAEAYYRRGTARKYAGHWKEYQADKDRAEALGRVSEPEPKPVADRKQT